MKIPIARLVRHPDLQMRAALDPAVVAEYAAAYSDGVGLPPLQAAVAGISAPDTNLCPSLWPTIWLWDGYHRLAGAEAAGLSEIDVDICPVGSFRDALLLAVGANARHGLRRSQADKRRAVETLLRDDEWTAKSDRQIARLAVVSHTYVANLRRELSPAPVDTGLALEQGAGAAAAGTPRTECPYEPGTAVSGAWHAGYDHPNNTFPAVHPPICDCRGDEVAAGEIVEYIPPIGMPKRARVEGGGAGTVDLTVWDPAMGSIEEYGRRVSTSWDAIRKLAGAPAPCTPGAPGATALATISSEDRCAAYRAGRCAFKAGASVVDAYKGYDARLAKDVASGWCEARDDAKASKTLGDASHFRPADPAPGPVPDEPPAGEEPTGAEDDAEFIIDAYTNGGQRIIVCLGDVERQLSIDEAKGLIARVSDAIEDATFTEPGRVCRECGCTDDDCSGCSEKTGEPCHWVEDDLCSACATPEPSDEPSAPDPDPAPEPEPPAPGPTNDLRAADLRNAMKLHAALPSRPIVQMDDDQRRIWRLVCVPATGGVRRELHASLPSKAAAKREFADLLASSGAISIDGLIRQDLPGFVIYRRRDEGGGRHSIRCTPSWCIAVAPDGSPCKYESHDAINAAWLDLVVCGDAALED